MNDFLQEIADDKVGASPVEFREYISALLELLFEKSKAVGAWAAVTDLDSAEGSIAVVNRGSVFYAVPFSSIIDLGRILQIPRAEELVGQ